MKVWQQLLGLFVNVNKKNKRRWTLDQLAAIGEEHKDGMARLRSNLPQASNIIGVGVNVEADVPFFIVLYLKGTKVKFKELPTQVDTGLSVRYEFREMARFV